MLELNAVLEVNSVLKLNACLEVNSVLEVNFKLHDILKSWLKLFLGNLLFFYGPIQCFI